MLKFPSTLVSIIGGTLLAMSGPVAASNALLAQDPAAVSAEVDAFLRGQAASYPGSTHIIVEPPRLTNQPACAHLQAFLPTGQRLRSRMTVGVRCMAPQTWTTYVQANLSILGYYYVANRSIQVGDILSLDDLSAREGDILRLSGGTVFDPSQAVGYVASQRIPAGGPIKARSLRSPDSIQRGQTVRTEARGLGFVATGEGKALENGAPGSQIQVRSSSGQIVSGTVLNANTVQVMM
ncbi:MAG TPA: flagellar basal body P-ring formation chaperone FlgA [Burkholderiaceae bacterium]|nr:flagellar basal body P-ring formation chaperone FlgA [Burkholderiaceae bacterium]